MKLKTRRKTPITTSSLSTKQGPSSSKEQVFHAGTGSSANPLASARLIRRFHVLLKRKAQLEKTRASTEAARELSDVEEEIERMGGLAAYQRMSSIGQGKDRGGGSESVLLGWLKELDVRSSLKTKGKEKMRLLEVGALKPDNYTSCSSWINAHPIDLRSQHPGIVEQDFLKMDLAENADTWDAISLSLVVNFVPEPHDRGRMLQYAHNMLREGGLLFFALPLPCVSNSRYLNFEHLTLLMSRIGFKRVRERWKAGGKMAYWLYRKYARPSIGKGDQKEADVRFDKKVVLREGKRNNFCILF